MFGGIIFKKEPLFYGSDNVDMVVKIAKILGTEKLMEYMEKYNLILPIELRDNMSFYTKKPWTKFITT